MKRWASSRILPGAEPRCPIRRLSENPLRVFRLRVPKTAMKGVWLLLAAVLAQPSTALNHQHPAGEAKPNVILISVDTLRSDRLSCNAPTAPPTPNIDKFSRGGTSFSQGTSMVPLTLPSHVSMLTSTYPFVSGVEDNGDRLAPGTVTLASTLRSHGYRTAAFLGGFVLDKRFGLDQGFDTYDSPSASLNSGSSDPGDIKRKGEAVAKAGEEWLNANSDRPFFLFLHFYDLHTPYNLSAEEKTKYGEGYNGELGYIDHVIGGLWDYLVTHDLVNKSLIVFTSDHGEGLGEHGESTHGYFIYQSTLHVPLIIHWPAGGAPMPARVDAPASLLDVSPTILDAVRLPVPPAMEGKSLLRASPADIFSESVYPQKHFGTSSLASLRSGHYKYIEAPRPEFYDLAQDPGELTNLYESKASVASAYRERLNQLRLLYKPRVQGTQNALSPEAIARLHALGYLTGRNSAPTPTSSAIDPKDRIVDYEKYGQAIYLASAGHLDESNAVLIAILARDPDLSDVHLTLGLNQQRMGKDAEAVEQFRTVLAADPTSAIAHLDAGLSYYNLRQFDQADKEFNAALAISPGYAKAEIFLARTLAQKGQLDQAAAEFHQVLQETPDSYDAHDGLGTLAAMRGDWDESERQLQAALSIGPAAAGTHNTLGGVYLRKGEIDAARSQFEEAVRLKPDYAAAHYNLGVVFVALKQLDPARSEFQKALSADPGYRPAQEALARLNQSP
jgi:choline-sulfatase